MEKRTVMAIVLSVVVMLGFFMIQSLLFPPPKPAVQPSGQSPQQAPGQAQGQTSQGNVTPVSPSGGNQGAVSPTPAPAVQSSETQELPPAIPEENVPSQTVVVETDLLRVELTNAGGNIVSFRLKKYPDDGKPVEMILAGKNEPQAFAVAFGNREDVMAKKVNPENRNFRVNRISDLIVEFSQDFSTSSGGRFTMIKRYEFKPEEYMFQLDITLDGGHSVSSFDFQGAGYTLIYGPQIGPKFEKLDQRYEYRHYLSYKGKLKNEKVTEKEPDVILSQPTWAAIAGKYFALIAMPYVNQYELAFSAQNESGLPNASRLFISRPASNSSRIEDKYNFYLGPKKLESSQDKVYGLEKGLNVYDNGDNGFKIRDSGLLEAADTKGFLAPLEKVLKWLLVLFYNIVPNYGVSIIVVTILVKLLMFPLTKKGSESTLRMQALAPKIKEIQTKYKDNPQKMNAEMAQFYKKEGYNPISGCLPMIIQIPIFFAMYNLFNSHFDLRGAVFIPGWIPDLSRPESIYNFPDNFRLPLLGWSAIRLLPFIYVGSQLLYGKVTQTPDQKGNAQMKLMLYAMPIVFFFILYDVPAGLLIYWIISNVLTLVQQLSINKYLARKKAAAAAEEPKPVIAPAGPKKKRKR